MEAFEAVARRHNALGLTEEIEPTVRLFHARPFRVIGSGRFADACLAQVEDEWLRSLPLDRRRSTSGRTPRTCSATRLSARRLGSRLEP